jgi:hypothetical protein
MIEELNQALRDYQADWRQLCAARADQEFFSQLRPSSVAWKFADLETLEVALAALRPLCDQIHMSYRNDRWLATLHLPDSPLRWGIEVIGLMQRRPDSQDALGLDNVNFFVPHFAVTQEVLGREPELKWTQESSGPHSQWLSLWFADREAKLRDRTILDVCIDELRDSRDSVIGKIQ